MWPGIVVVVVTFPATQPDRKPGEPNGDAAWTKNGVVFIEVKDPGRLQIPAALENRIWNYDPWMRMGPQPWRVPHGTCIRSDPILRDA